MATRPASKAAKKSASVKVAAPAKSVPARKTAKGVEWLLPVEPFAAEVAKLKGRPEESEPAPVKLLPANDTKQPPAKSLKAQILEVLKDSLRIEVDDGDFTDPNSRTVKLLLDGKCISQARFDVKARREYEG